MGSVYRRGDSKSWWIAYVGIGGKRILESSQTSDKAVARQRLKAREQEVAGLRKAGIGAEAAPTVKWWGGKWVPGRKESGVRTWDDEEQRLRTHVYPVIGHMLLRDVTPDHTQLVVDSVTDKGRATRTIRNVYEVMRVMFDDALRAKLITSTPCILRVRRGELPARADKNPLFRSGAIFTRGELEILISDERIPHYRRVLWALMFVGGPRVNEVTPRRWRDYDPDAEPLGRLTIDSHWDKRHRVLLSGSKTGPGRDIPVHPTLAKVLATWRMSGWAKMNGRQPTPDDLILESASGKILNSNGTQLHLDKDCKVLGLRKRRQHDMRRTFVTLGRSAPGANDAILKWISHGPSKQIMDLYTTPPWEVLCEQVLKLKVGLLEGRQLAMAATAGLRSSQSPTPKGGYMMHEPGLEPRQLVGVDAHQEANKADCAEEVAARETPSIPDVSSERSNVATDYEKLGVLLGFKVSPRRTRGGS